MAIKLIATYSKKLGLPGFSSHSFSVTIETELITTEGIASESQRIYQLLQSNVDEQIQTTGFVPPKEYGFETSPENPAGDQPEQDTSPGSNTNWSRGPAWKCSDKQKDLILKLVEEHQLNKADVEALAVERFGKGVRQLNKIEASGLIDELLDKHGGGSTGQTNGKRRNGSAYGGANGRRAA